MALFDLVCPNCQAGLVVDTTAGATATVGETLKIVDFASPEDMAKAEETIQNAAQQAEQGRMTYAQALADIEAARNASRLAALVRKTQAEAAPPEPAPEEAPVEPPAEAPAEVPADVPAPAEAPADAPAEFVNPTPVPEPTPEPEQVPAEVVTNA